MVSVKLYVEGGGDSKTSRTACRKGFQRFIEKAGLQGRMPRVVACGSRRNAYESFKTAHAGQDTTVLLLVDAEGPVTAESPWHHLEIHDNWERPDHATDDHCHLMVQIMESWFLADPQTLKTFYGQGYRPDALPSDQHVERIAKRDVLNGLARATRDTAKGRHDKGTHSFRILEKLDPETITNASPHAKRLIELLGETGRA